MSGNKVEIIEDDPFKLFEYVRDSWLNITMESMNEIMFRREGIDQKESWISIIITILEISKILVDG